MFADDERSLQELMRIELARMGHEVTICADGLAAAAALERQAYDCIIVDLDMPGLSGIEVVARARELSPETEAVILTGKSTLESAVAALRHGAFDYLTKPCKLSDLESLLQRVVLQRELTNKYRAVKRQLDRVNGGSQLIGDSPAMERVRQLIAKVAPSQSSVLILGETGTGKELVARALHDQSPRREQPFVAINCGALPENLIESELFGHKKGSFTGADEHRAGLFEVADNGTLFLDEIGELPRSMQAKLLRVLESREIRRVGDNTSIKVDVRVVSATHRRLDQMVAASEFREDLLFRINTFEIQLPSLRQRSGDVPQLAIHLARRFQPAVKPNEAIFTAEALDRLQSHAWPGNVRELANVIEHASILCERLPIDVEHLPERFQAMQVAPWFAKGTGPLSLREIELQAIHHSLERNDGNKPKAAEELGISLKTLYNKLNSDTHLEKSA
ncbi:MAG: sigma-54 dependent transcriptional regulator [Pirellulales bacterium]|nr:sigma-54 dependent transcriptional regulator [Pirellulales bacterium]